VWLRLDASLTIELDLTTMQHTRWLKVRIGGRTRSTLQLQLGPRHFNFID
jgi:hypothetical protein